MRTTELTTERLILREFEESDWRHVHEYAVDPDVYKFMPWGPNTEEDSRNHVQRAISFRQEELRAKYQLAVILKTNQTFIGGCGITVSDAGNREGWIGYCLNKKFWRQGYMTEAAARLLEFGFGKLDLHRVFATCDTENTASTRVLEKIGMQREGLLRDHKLIRTNWRNSFLYAALEHEWELNGCSRGR